jgi:aminoglycoside 6'-N-acetyltransferase I
VTIRPVERGDMRAYQALRRELWPQVTVDENERETDAIAGDSRRWAVFVCETERGVVGFVEAHLREYAEGCASSPVGFIEGWYVEPAARRKGVGRRLVAAAEDWARTRGCTEMASDAELANVESHRAHAALGYEETERLVCFRRSLM